MYCKEKKILFVQRVITAYRLELLKLLGSSFKEVGIISAKGEAKGTLKLAKYREDEVQNANLKIYVLPAIRMSYKGESRGTSLYLYPKAISIIKQYDIIVFEGTTNLLNNLYLVPYAKILNKKMLWWDAGYSPSQRTLKRKWIDFVVRPLVKMTTVQMAYSSLAAVYMKKYMGARRVFLNLNTINTAYFESIAGEIRQNNAQYVFDKSRIKLLYVGVVETRKKVKELIDIVLELNREFSDRLYELIVIGGGEQLQELKEYTQNQNEIHLLGPIYEKDVLKKYYFASDLFVLPGDGGLAILQALLFGLPVLSIIGADGTEQDYIPDKRFLVKNTKDIKTFLKNIQTINRTQFIKDIPPLSSKNWVKKLTTKLCPEESVN